MPEMKPATSPPTETLPEESPQSEIDVEAARHRAKVLLIQPMPGLPGHEEYQNQMDAFSVNPGGAEEGDLLEFYNTSQDELLKRLLNTCRERGKWEPIFLNELFDFNENWPDRHKINQLVHHSAIGVVGNEVNFKEMVIYPLPGMLKDKS